MTICRLSSIAAIVFFCVLIENAHSFSKKFPSKTQRRRSGQPPLRYLPPNHRRLAILFSDDSTEYEDGTLIPEELQPQQQKQPIPSASPLVPPKRLDPLMASLTRVDPSSSEVPTKNIPLLGEIPVDGSLALLIPAAGIAVIGFILSIAIAIQSRDEIVGLLSQVSEGITQSAISQSNQVYDDSICRGICGPQQQDFEGLKNFMEGLKK
jgi:hypothetical protein